MNKLIYVLVAFCTFTVAKASADDIEIYLKGASSGAPYVNLVLEYRPVTVSSEICKYDDTCQVAPADPATCPDGQVCLTTEAYANLGTRTTGEKITRLDVFVAILATIFDNPLFKGIYMSLIINNDDGGGGDKGGGSIIEGYKLLETHKGELIATLKSIPDVGSSGVHEVQPKEAYYEWYRYVNEGRVALGKDNAGNYGGDLTGPTYDPDILRPVNTGNTYVSPFTDPNSCPKLFSIILATNSSQQDDDLNTEIKASFGSDASSWGRNFKFDVMFEYMHDSGTDLLSTVNGTQAFEKSWVISKPNSSGQYLAEIKDWGTAAGNVSLLNLDDPEELEKDLTNAFKEVISVSSTFVAASVPVNVFNRAESLDNLFIAVFEAQSTQDWPGNIKKLKLRDIDGDGKFDDIIDASSPPKPGFASTGDDRGRITFDALTYWTDAANLPSVDGSLAPSGADGRVVARGGAGQKINGFVADATHIIGDANTGPAGVSTRQVYVEPASFTNGTAAVFDDFDVDADTLALSGIKAALGDATMSDADALDLIRWGRGQDVDAGSTDARSWILSDAIHSRPLAINYGTTGGYSTTNPNIRLFFGTGDGLFHIIENTTTAPVESGTEVFAFYPRELLANIEVLRTDTEPSLNMRYGVDGAPSVLVVDNNNDAELVASGSAPDGGDEVYIYFGLRRGGKSYYALDVSNPSATPKIKWKISRTSGGDFDELGLTFSKPIVGKVKYGSTATEVVIFAGGYNGGWDSTYTNRLGKDLNSDPDNTVGNAIYIVDARTGALIWKAVKGSTGTGAGSVSGSVAKYEHPDLEDSIPSNVTPLKNSNGVIHRLYVGDTGGAVWRVDLPELNSDDRATKWFVSKLAELGNDGSTAASDRRFFHSPDVVETFDDTGDFDGVIISSGDRAHPNETVVTNYHFYIKDRLITSGDASVKSRTPFVATDPSAPAVADLPDQTACITGDEVTGCASSFPNGWKIELTRSGEKGLSTALVDGGRAFMTTFVPASGDLCEPTEGNGFVYVANLEDGTATYNERFYEVGLGIPSGAITLGKSILIPGAGIDPNEPSCPPTHPDYPDCKPCPFGKLCDSLTETMFHIYWREPGIDRL